MRLLADESVDMAVVRALRAAGPISEDKDFGRFAAAEGDFPGVVLLRFDARARALIVKAAVDLFASYGDSLLGSMVVLEPGRVRFHRT